MTDWVIVRIHKDRLESVKETLPHFECPFCGDLLFCSFGDLGGTTYNCPVCDQVVGVDPNTHRTWQSHPDPRPPYVPAKMWQVAYGELWEEV